MTLKFAGTSTRSHLDHLQHCSVSGLAHYYYAAWYTCRRTYILHGFLFLFFASYSRSSLNGTRPKLATCSEVSAIWRRMSEIWDIPFPYKSGAQKPPFRQFRNLTATLTAYIFRTKHDIHNRVSALTTTRGLLYRPKTTWTLVHKRLKTGPPFLPPSANSAFYFIARLLRQGSANGTQPNFGKWWTANRANNLPQKRQGHFPKKNWEPKALHLFGFSTTSRLNGEYLLNGARRRQLSKGVGK